MVASSLVEAGRAWAWSRAFPPALALATTAGLFWLQSRIPGPLPTALMLLAIAVPLGTFGIYLSTLARIRALGFLSDESLIRRYLPGTWVRLVVGWIAGLIAAVVVAVQLLTFRGPLDWILLGSAVPIFLVTWRLIGKRLRREVRPCYRVGWSLRMATLPATLVLVLIETGTTAFRGGVPRYPNLGAAIDAAREGAAMFGDSAIAAAMVAATGILNGLKAYLLGSLSGAGGIAAAAALLCLGLLAWPFYWIVSCYVASFLVPRQEYGRVLAPLVDTAMPPPVPPSRIFGAAILSALVLLVIYPSFVVTVDQWLRSQPWIVEQLDRIEVFAEKIDNVIVKPGTIDEITQKREEILAKHAGQRAGLAAATNAGFDRMEANVDDYLDWYYSLSAEYVRIGKMLVGELEEYLASELAERLAAGDPFRQLEDEFERLLAENEAVLKSYRTAVVEILQRNRIEPGPDRGHIRVLAEATSADLLVLPDQFAPFRTRLGVGAAAGGVAGALGAVIAGKVVAKMMAKGVLKVGAKALLKMGGGKLAGSAGGATAGAAAGAAVGSIVPGVGTAVGAVIGGLVVGIAVGLGADYLMLELEESYSRDDHRAELIEELRQLRAETLALLAPPAPEAQP